MEYSLWAFALGTLSAVSLPLGSWVGLTFRFRAHQIAVLAAFGAGALLAALSVELVAPTTFALLEAGPEDADEARSAFYALIAGCVVGGLLYIGLNTVVNGQGGFRRKRSTLISHYRKVAKGQQQQILDRLAEIPLFRLEPNHLDALMAVAEPVTFKDGDVIVEEGRPADDVIVVVAGRVTVEFEGEKLPDPLTEKAVLGLMAMMTEAPYGAAATADGTVKTLRIDKRGIEHLRALSPQFDRACREAAAGALELLAGRVAEKHQRTVEWLHGAERSLLEQSAMPTLPPRRSEKHEHRGAPLAVWLGILLDGIPESLVIGAGMFGLLTAKLQAGEPVAFVAVIPFTLIAGLFLSNFPEALSSSANMAAQGWSRGKVFMMWFALMVITGIGSWAGYMVAGELGHTSLVLFEGLAAGAMLTMIAAAMIPEAALMASGNAVGISTLAGFLGAILFKLLE